MDMKMSNSYLIKEVNYHSLLELTGNYWGKTVMDFVRDQNPVNHFGSSSANLDLEFLKDPEKCRELKELLDKKYLPMLNLQEKKAVVFRSFYLILINYIMKFVASLTLCSSVVLPVFIFPLGLSDIPTTGLKSQNYITDKFFISEEFIQSEFMPPISPPSFAPPSAPSGLRITN
jgi:hypothetical protein